ncbi:MAG: SAM-dependent methyltransferase [Lachnospiraceae bacterium]|nr:SAM-dependent methyltransferase [Lachnospiraceae bacterium]
MKDRMKQEIVLSQRMQMVADMVSKGNVLADIGCDHGFVSIYLLENGICPKVIAMDVNEGPLLRAKEHIEERGLSSYIDVRLSDGMEKLLFGEADSVLIAGMGGRLVIKILTDCMDKAKDLKEIVLQPQSELHLVRQFLTDMGFHIIQEDIVKDNGKFYPAMRVAWRGEKAQALSEEELWYGPLLLKEKHPVLQEYLEKEKAKYAQIAEDIVNNGNNTDKATEDTIRKRRSLIDTALACFM